MADQFNPGDVVRLRSGGPTMTVDEVANDMTGKPTVWCIWLDGSKKMTDTFPAAVLKHVEK